MSNFVKRQAQQRILPSEETRKKRGALRFLGVVIIYSGSPLVRFSQLLAPAPPRVAFSCLLLPPPASPALNCRWPLLWQRQPARQVLKHYFALPCDMQRCARDESTAGWCFFQTAAPHRVCVRGSGSCLSELKPSCKSSRPHVAGGHNEYSRFFPIVL